MSNKSANKLENLNRHNQSYIFINRLTLFYTFVGVTYLLFFKSTPQCTCASFNYLSTKEVLSANTLLTTEEANIVNTTTTATPDIPIIPSSGSKRNLLSSNTTIRSVKRNYELIQNLYSMLPNGIVIIWYGSISTIPPGWKICDGTNGTPDLRDRFVIGGGNLYTLNDIGGSTTTILSTDQLATHQHDITNIASTTHTGHTHSRGTFSLSSYSHTHTWSDTSTSDGDHSHTCNTNNPSGGSHSHTCSSNTGYTGDHTHTWGDWTDTRGNHNHANGDWKYLVRKNADGYLSADGWDYTAGEIDNLNGGTMTSTGNHAHYVDGTTSTDGDHRHSFSCGITNTGSHAHSTTCSTVNTGSHTHNVDGTTSVDNSHTHTISGITGNAGTHSHLSNGNTESVGSSNSINILNPYYTAYYIMKVPHIFPTDDPTESPTLAPSNVPSLAPTIAPTLAPSLSPTVAPSNAPSNNPSLAPSLVPTLTPTQPPSLTPSLSPTIAPSPSPASDPTAAPTISPTLIPSLAPSLQPTLAPSSVPTSPPSIVPSITPTLAPSLSPSIAPTTPPSNIPSIAPSNAPSIFPSISPTLAPSLSPTLSPSFAPTSMPTPMCWAAKFKGILIKSNNLNRNDILYSGESLVSPNCRFILTMNENGNLILNGLVGKYEDPFEKDENGVFTNNKNKMRIYNGWETNTTIENNSGESTAVMMLKDGTLMVEEHEFIGVPEFEPIELWKSGESIEENELILELTDNGCLTLNEYYGSINTDHLIPFWFVCAQLESSRNDNVKPNGIIDDIQPSTTIETTILTTNKNNNNEENEIFGLNIGNNKDNIQLLTIWNVIISIILILILLICLYFCIKQIYNNYQSNDVANYNISSKMSTHIVKSESNWEMANQHDDNDDDEGDDDDIDEQMKQAIELWSMETNNVTTIMQQTNN